MQYWNTITRLGIVRVTTEYRSSTAALSQAIREWMEAGLVDPQNLLMAKVKPNEAEYQLLQTKRDLETGRMALSSLIGVEPYTPTEIEDATSAVVLDGELQRIGGTDRPELKVAYARIKTVESSKRLTDARYKPQFYVGVNGSYSSLGYNFHPDLNPNYTVYVKLPVPLFEWGKGCGGKRTTSLKIGTTTDNLNQVIDLIKLEVETARASFSQTLRQTRPVGSSLGKALENERMALGWYAGGKASVTEVIKAQAYQQAFQINYVQARVSAQRFYSELVRASNKY